MIFQEAAFGWPFSFLRFHLVSPDLPCPPRAGFFISGRTDMQKLPEIAEIPIEPMAARVEQITSTVTYGGAGVTGVTAWLNWLGQNQSGIATAVMIGTFIVTVLSAAYGIYHRHQFRKIASEQGIDAVRRSER